MNNNILIAKLKEYIIPKIPCKKSDKGRPYSVSHDKLMEAIFYILKHGITWELASQLVMGDTKYKSTLNRRYNELIKYGIITDIHKQLTQEYINENKIDDVYIDSMDTINGNCNKKNTAKSFKLHKQAVRITLICDKNKIPLSYRTDPARDNDNVLGFKLASAFHINDKKVHFLVGDKGYQMIYDKKQMLIRENKLYLITPKKKYKRKIVYKTKNYKRKIKRIRHSKRMKESLRGRIKVEHCNSILHRSFKRLQIVYDKSMMTFNAFTELAIICIILHQNNQPKTKKI